MRLLLAAAAAALMVTQASAQVSDQQVRARYTRAYSRCLASPGGQSTLGMIECMSQELKVQDARLNRAYRNTMAGLTTVEKQRLRTAQRAWLKFRDAQCFALEDPEQWGSISRVNAQQCMLDRTIARTIELENFPPKEG